MSGGVRNLRAMFENKDESSTSPDRGRPSAGSIVGGSNDTSSQSLSKVRTSFVAVERSGQLGSQWGLRKDSNPDPSLATRRESLSIDEETNLKSLADHKQSISPELSARKSSIVVTETIAESAIETSPVEPEKKPVYMNGENEHGKVVPVESKPSSISDKKTAVEGSNTKLLPADTKSRAVASRGAELNNVGGSGESLNGKINGKLKPNSATKDTSKTAPAARTTKPVPISTTPSLTTTKIAPKPTKSSVIPKTPTSPAKTPTAPRKSSKASNTKPAASMAQTKAADMKIIKSTTSSTTTSRPAAQSTTSSAVASTSEYKPLQASPSTGLHKPKPRSPTRPAKLPTSMTAPTASSLSKASITATSGRQSLGSSTKTVSRSPSHANLSQKQELRRKSSNIDGERLTFGKLSTSMLKKQPSRQSLSKQISPADDSFLARMMRPTASSASKTHEKVITPPRAKTTTRPTTRDGPTSHKPHQGLRGSPSTKVLPSAAKESKKEWSNAGQSGGVDGLVASIDGGNEAKQAGIAKDETKIFMTAADEVVAASSHETEHIEEIPVKWNSTVAAGPATAAENKVDSDMHPGPIASEELKPTIQAANSAKNESSAVEPVVLGEPENPAEATVNAKEPVVS